LNGKRKVINQEQIGIILLIRELITMKQLGLKGTGDI